MITHGSTFSGIGAPEVAATMLGWENAFHCEINPFGRQILDYYYPNSESYEDITKTDFSKWRGRIDVLTGGFPCQPFSYAGKRKGTEDDRYLWPFMLKCIEQVRPTWFVGENVGGIATMVFPGEDVEMGNTDSLFQEGNLFRTDERFVIEEICESLERAGYSVQPMLIPACAVGAPHRRDRIFFIAHRNDAADTDCTRQPTSNEQGRCERKTMDGECESIAFNGVGRLGTRKSSSDTMCRRSDKRTTEVRSEIANGQRTVCDGSEWTVTNTESEQGDGLRLEQREFSQSQSCKPGRRNCEDGSEGQDASHANGTRLQNADDERSLCEKGKQARKDGTGNDFGNSYLLPNNRWRHFPAQSPVYRGNDGFPFDVDDLAIPFSKWKTESLKAYGNAIVVQVMYEIFRAIDEIENNK